MAVAKRRLGGFGFSCVFALLAASIPAPARALHPESPQVKEAIAKGLKYLETAVDGRTGGKCLIGLAFIKNNASLEHPKIQEAIAHIQAIVKNSPSGVNDDIYSSGLAIMFLCEVDPSKYRAEIEAYVKSLHVKQKAHGAWGYPVETKTLGATCDTSMTQYAVLGLWLAEEMAGVETPPEVWNKVAAWLIKTQSPEGGFGYQGTPSAELGERVAQAAVRHSMTAAGMGSLYIVRERLGLSRLKKTADDDTPDVLVPYETEDERTARIRTEIEREHFLRSLSRGNAWMESNYKISQIKEWLHYSLYALERYESLKEEEEKLEQIDPTARNKIPGWYHEGSRVLVDAQLEDGTWKGEATAVPDTAFAVLFLQRSTQKTLAKARGARREAGVMIAGRGLPELAEVRLRDGAVVPQPLAADVDEALAIVADPSHPAHERALETLADVARGGDRATLAAHAGDWARLAMGASPEARLLAIEAIARSHDLDQAPLLISLLEDADLAVIRAAGEALGTISRNHQLVELPPQPSQPERAAAVARCREWFLALRPDFEFASYDPLVFAP